MRSYFNGKKLGMSVHACHPSYKWEALVEWLSRLARVKMRPYLQNNHTIKDRR
jgi:hypothetical protein